MATMLGKNAKVTTASGTVTEVTSWSLDISASAIEASTMGHDGWNTVHGLDVTGYTGSASLLFDKDDASQDLLRDAMIAGTKLTDVKFYVDATNYYTPDTSTRATAGLYVESYSVSADTGAVVGFDMTFKGNGPIHLTS